MEAKEAIVLGKDGKSIYTPEGLSERAKQSSEKVIFSYRKMSGLQKIMIAPLIGIGLLFLLFFVTLISVVFILSFIKKKAFSR